MKKSPTGKKYTFMVSLSLLLVYLLSNIAAIAQSSNTIYPSNQNDTHILDLAPPFLLEIQTPRGRPIFYATIFNSLNDKKEVQKEVLFKEHLDDRDFVKVLHLGTQVYLISTDFLLDINMRIFYYQSLDVPSLKLGNPQEFNRYFTKNVAENYGVEVSKDQSNLLLFTPKHYNEKEYVKFDISIFDSQFQKTIIHNFTLPYQHKNYQVLQGLIANNGDIYIVANIYSKYGKQLKYVSLLGIQNDGQHQERIIPTKNLSISNQSFIINKHNQLIGIGLGQGKNSSQPVSKKEQLWYATLSTPIATMKSQFFSLDKSSLKNIFHHGQQYWTNQVTLNSLFLRTDNSLLIEFNHYRFPKGNEEHAVVIDEVSGMIIDYQLHQESVFISLQNQQIEWVSLIGSPNSSSFNKGHNKKMIIPKEGLNHQYWEKMPKKETPSSIYLKRKLDRAGKMTIRLVIL